MKTTQEFPDLKLARVLDAVLEQFTTRKIKRPVTVRQWLAFSVWGIQQHYTKWSKMNLGLSRGAVQSALQNLDEPELAGEYAREIAGAYEDELGEVASETAMSTATYLINEAGDWGEYLTDLPFVGLGKAMVRAGTKAWSAADMQRTVDAIFRDESSCRNDFVGIEDSTFACACNACRMPTLADEFRVHVTDKYAEQAGFDSVTGPLKKLIGSDFIEKTVASTSSLAASAYEYFSGIQQQVSELELDDETKLFQALFEHLSAERQRVLKSLVETAARDQCKRAQALIAFLLGELTLVASSFANTDTPALEWSNEISTSYASYPKTISVMVNPVGHFMLAAALAGRQV